MPKWKSPIRWDVIKKWRKFIIDTSLYDATSDAKIFFIFRDLWEMEDGLSFKELCLILHPKLVERDPITGEIIGPNNRNHGLTRQEIKNVRDNKFYSKSLVLFCIQDHKTGALIYFNIGTRALFRKVENRLNKIIKGIEESRDRSISVYKIPLERRKKLSKNTADEIRRQVIKKLTKEMERKRKKEMEQLVREAEQQQVLAEEREEDE